MRRPDTFWEGDPASQRGENVSVPTWIDGYTKYIFYRLLVARYTDERNDLFWLLDWPESSTQHHISY